MDIVIVFRARSETINFSMLLRSYNIRHQTINTPRVINVSCGISIRASIDDIDKIDMILSRRKFTTYAGIYKVENNSLRPKVIRIR